ncbi:MAG: hypothetical protein H6818_24220 [Phycisphaerales bacterium]|nr:hypothetical protein [Phycisphaerales bacterium]
MIDTPEKRRNMEAYVKMKIQDIFEKIIRERFPVIEGLPADDAEHLQGTIEYLDDDKLEEGTVLEGNEFFEWACRRFEEEVLETWFREETIDALVHYAGDMLCDHPEFSDEQIRAAVQYYATRGRIGDLFERFDDGTEKWLELVKLSVTERCNSAGDESQ